MSEADERATPRVVTTSVYPPEGGTTNGDGTYPEGTQVTVVAMNNTNYAFINWTYVNGVEASRSESYTFTLSGNATLTANFEYHEEAHCYNCAYFRSWTATDTDAGICRRYPPEVIPAPASEPSERIGVSVWAEVLGTEWCGEHKHTIISPVKEPLGLPPTGSGISGSGPVGGVG